MENTATNTDRTVPGNQLGVISAGQAPQDKFETAAEIPKVENDYFWNDGGCRLFAASLLRQSLQDYCRGERDKDHRTAKRWIENGDLGGGITFNMCAQMLSLDIDPDQLRARMLQNPQEMLTQLNDYFKGARIQPRDDETAINTELQDEEDDSNSNAESSPQFPTSNFSRPRG